MFEAKVAEVFVLLARSSQWAAVSGERESICAAGVGCLFVLKDVQDTVLESVQASH